MTQTRFSPNDAHGGARFPSIPLLPRAGAGLKPEHVSEILADKECVGFFEVHAENYMGKGGAPHAALSLIRQEYPLSVHGVGLSIGGAGPLDTEHLQRLASVVARYEPALVSEHLAWSTHEETYFNDLLPVPYTEEVLDRVVEHVDQVQEALGRQMLLENPSTYVAFEQSTMSELDFIKAVARRTGCGLLLDINNVFVSATNHAFSPETYLDRFPLALVREIHLAGHASEEDDFGAPLLIDAHDRPVADGVWALYDRVIGSTGPIPTLIEWDNDVPAWEVLKSEAAAADKILARHADNRLLGRRHA
jgi:uncharacterized protein (UPF0276 family)